MAFFGGKNLLAKALAGLLLALCLGTFAPNARAASAFEIDSLTEKHHVTADRTLYHSRERVYEAFGHVVVSSRGQRLSADYLWMDDNTKEIKARGNVTYVTRGKDGRSGTTIQAAELHINLATGIGSVFYGKVSNDLYSLKGQLIRRVSEDRFLTTDGEYTTCKDCAESWKLSARNVELTVEGYAFMESVFVKIKDVPTVFIPYLIVPVKTKRQSGLLFPRIGLNTSHGFVFVQPFYWAIDDHQDLTLGLGRYSGRGMRYELEHRYKSYNGIEGQLTVFHTNDRKFRDQLRAQGIQGRGDRTAIISNNQWPISENLQARMRVYEVLDRDYPLDFPEDIIGRQLANLESSAVVTTPWDNFFLSVEARRYRNLLTDTPVGFDGGTVQALPTAHFGVKPVTVAGPLMVSAYGRFDRFQRHNGSFHDTERNRDALGQLVYDPGTDYIREANRFIFQPELSAPFRLGNFLSIGPSLTYNEIRYDFDVPLAGGQRVPDTSTRYLQARLEVAATVEKVYDYNGKNFSKLKHQLTPFFTLSNIPWLQQGSPSHPFNGQGGQIESNWGLFDQFDRVPYTNNTDFLRHPEGKSIYYGVTSRLIRKRRRPEEMQPRAYPYDLIPSKPKTYPKPQNRKQELEIARQQAFDQYNPRYEDYQEVWTVNLSQAYDFKAAERESRKTDGDPKRAFSYLLAKSNLNLDNFASGIEYRFFPRISNRSIASLNQNVPEEVYRNKHFVTASLQWYLQKLSNERKTRSFVRSLEGYFTYGSRPNPSRTARAVVNWSFNDLVSAKIDYSFDLLEKNQLDWSARLLLTHPSECWGLSTSYNWLRNRSEQKGELGFQLLLNLLGTGFLGGDQLRSDTGSPAGTFGGL